MGECVHRNASPLHGKQPARCPQVRGQKEVTQDLSLDH